MDLSLLAHAMPQETTNNSMINKDKLFSDFDAIKNGVADCNLSESIVLAQLPDSKEIPITSVRCIMQLCVMHYSTP